MEFSYLDLFFAIPLLWGIVSGLMNGFIRSLSVFVGLVLGIYLAHIYAPDLSPPNGASPLDAHLPYNRCRNIS